MTNNGWDLTQIEVHRNSSDILTSIKSNCPDQTRPMK